MRKLIILLWIFLISIITISGDTTFNFLTKGHADTLYCALSTGCGETEIEVFVAWNYTIDFGSLSGGNLTCTHSTEDCSLNITESGGVNPMQVTFNFTNVTTFSQAVFRTWYSAGASHTINIEIWHFPDRDWELIGTITDQSDFTPFSIPILDANNHINDTNASLRFRHLGLGNPSHELRLDFVSLQGETGIISFDHDDLSGRSDFTNNHPPYAVAIGTLNTSIDTLNSTKYDKTGGDISGNVTILSNLNVTGVIINQNFSTSHNPNNSSMDYNGEPRIIFKRD